MTTTLTITCKDKSVRYLTVMGNWSYTMALTLAKDIEGDNFSGVSIGK